MNEARPTVVRLHDAWLAPGPPTIGMDRRQLLDHDDRWLGWVRTDPGIERMTAVAGDLVFNPAHVMHREITGPGGPAELFVVRIGEGPLNINVEGPAPEAGSQA